MKLRLVHIRHKWCLVDAHPGVYRDGNGQEVSHFTWLLWLCEECPKYKVEKVEGHWKAEDLIL